MTGPEHYREAEKLLEQADRDVSVNMSAQTGEHKHDILAAAQVHATLAVAAASALHVDDPGRTDTEIDRAWREVAT